MDGSRFWDGSHRRIILHSDMNCFYANVECLHHPELRDKPVVVGGHEEDRHGIVLAKNQVAKGYGVQTGEVLWQARQKCPGLVVIPPDYHLYLKFSRLARSIYYDYTDRVEPFGPDEAWLDITGSVHLWGGDPLMVADEISERVKAELGVTVSVGVSWNKIFAKFGSDYKKPDAITVISPDNYQDLVWNAPVDELLYVGRATKRKLARAGIFSIGDLASTEPGRLKARLGKMGLVLHSFACGQDVTPVKVLDPVRSAVDYDIKSIGNGLTAPYDLVDEADTKLLVYLLAESVAQRLRENRVRAQTVSVAVRHAIDLGGCIHQAPLPLATNITSELASSAWRLLCEREQIAPGNPIRVLCVRAGNLQGVEAPVQADLFGNQERRERMERLDACVDGLRHRFGNQIVRRASELGNPRMSHLDIKRDNIVHPVGFFAR